ALAEFDVTATGFAVGGQINWRSRRALKAFFDAGHTVGNHSWSHPDYGAISVETFREETRRTHEALERWIGTKRFYRFPYLREGESEAAKGAADQVLADLGYVNAPVTIDTNDWSYNEKYLDALDRGDEQTAAKIVADYIAHLKERTLHFEAMAQDVLARDVSHILLLHMNQINADHLPTLLEWYVEEGWAFVTLETAMEDPLYEMPDLYVGSRGLSQIERVLQRD
ncbi:MAG: polysaccharide deacetylase family protein, partial [Pseudomonadota bacterium]